jgi:hypothetical protein
MHPTEQDTKASQCQRGDANFTQAFFSLATIVDSHNGALPHCLSIHVWGTGQFISE